MLLVGSIAFWSVVAYLAFKPHRTTLPAMGPIEVKVSRRDGRVASAQPRSARVIIERHPELPGQTHRTPLSGLAIRPALPVGAHPMGGAVGPVPMPSRFE